MKIRFWILALLIIFSAGFILPQKASATVMVGNVVESSVYGININYFTNYGYIEQYKPLWYAHTAEGLAVARTRLVKSGKLQNIPVLISIPSTIFTIYPEQTEISLESNCQISFGETTQEPKDIGECYKIHYVGGESYKDYLTLVALLTTITTERQKVANINLEQYQNNLTSELNELQNITRHFNPLWSPNSQYVVYTEWNDDEISYVVKDMANNNQADFKLAKGYPVYYPLWSSGSKYIAVASLETLTIFNTNKWESVSVDLPVYEKAANMETLLSFDSNRDRLMIARDKNLLFNYELLEYNLETGEMTSLATDIYRPEWEDIFQDQYYLRKTRATSPNGKWDALIKKENNISHITFENIVSVPNYSTERQADGATEKETGFPKTSRGAVLILGVTIVIFLLLSIVFIFIKLKSMKNKQKPRANMKNTSS